MTIRPTLTGAVRLILATATLGACAGAPQAPHDLRAAGPDSAGVGAARDQLAKSLLAADPAAILRAYGDSAVVVAAGSPTLVGSAAISAALRQIFATTTYQLVELHADRVFGSGGSLTEVGSQHAIGQEHGKPAEEGWSRYMLTWVRSPGGAWQVAADILIDDSARTVGKKK